MNYTAFAIAFTTSLFALGAAQGATATTTCTRQADARVIEIIAPGVIGQSCDVRYTRSGGANVSVPYHADNSDAFCNQKAAEMINRLTASGFICNANAPALRADAAAASSDYVVEVKRSETAVQLAAAEPSGAADSGAPDVAQRPIATSESTAQSDPLEDQMNKILAQPVVHAASRAPAQLIAQQAYLTPARPQPSAVGRIVGAQPSPLQPAIGVTQASLIEAPPAAAQPALQAAQPSSPEKATPKKPVLRTPAEVVTATLMAQAAAWNEGDLEGFMKGYWKSDELKFVSGAAITKGWDAALKRYRDRYAGGSGLGQLGFEKLDVKMATDDVAIVTGRFTLLNNNEASSGLFSLVMRLDNGAWRIVHDHTSADPKPAQ